MRVADYIADFLYRQGITEVFLVSGGGMMFLSDGIAQHPKLRAVCTHHEQAAAMAAVSYAKYHSSGAGAVYVTTGCGGTNAMTGLLDAWQDSIPCFFISGQVKRKETIRNSGLPLRQFGVQEADIISLVQPITKYAVMINDPEDIAYHLERGALLARSGRPGPVWLDVPLDVQGAPIDISRLRKFCSSEFSEDIKNSPTDDEIQTFEKLLGAAERPVVIAGQGIRLSRATEIFRSFVERQKIPVVATHLGVDALHTMHPLFTGLIGNKGDRAGNFAVQNADLVIVLGSRLSVSSTGHEYDKFARGAKVVVVDIDPIEHLKGTVRIDCLINSDLRHFFKKIENIPSCDRSSWHEKCLAWKVKYPVYRKEYAETVGGVNTYHFTECLSRCLKGDSVLVTDAGTAFHVLAQGVRLSENQRYITSGAQAEMGYALPACVGLSIAKKCGEVIGITGDGSLQMNIQELQTIKHHELPVKLFIWNNDGYLSIRATQAKFFNARFIGTDDSSGVSFPDTGKIAEAYGIRFLRVSEPADLEAVIEVALSHPGPVICEVICLRDQEVIPTVASYRREDGTMVSRPLEDMYPFLGREEFRREMIVKPLPD